MPPVDHLGERIQAGKYGHRLTRELYAVVNKKPTGRIYREQVSAEFWEAQDWAYEDADHTVLSDEFCILQREAALENFDLNMAFFAQLPQESFNTALNEVLEKNKSMRPVLDLTTLDGKEGVYVMVLDGYRQAYVGQTSDIRARIKSHWSGTKQFDRLLWGHKHESVLSIDAFRALDTTRIFAARTTRGFRLEERLVDTIPPDYLLNRIGGGEMNGFRSMFIAAELKRRQLAPDT
ncbi:GIY-YIG nuclease family protein [Arthrobacter sp. MDT3-24]